VDRATTGDAGSGTASGSTGGGTAGSGTGGGTADSGTAGDADETPAGAAGAPADAPTTVTAEPATEPATEPASEPATESPERSPAEPPVASRGRSRTAPGPRPDVEPTVESAVASAGAAPGGDAGSAGTGTGGPTEPVQRPAWGKTALVILAIALTALLILGIWALLSRNAENNDPGAAQRSRRPATSSPGRAVAPRKPTAPSSRAGSASQTAGLSSSPGVAGGFRRHTDPTGFSIDVPANWTGPERRSGGVFFYSPDRRTYVQIDQTDHPHPSALADWQNQERDAPAGFAGYRRIKLGPTGDQPPVPDTGDGSKSADWEFTWGSGAAKKHILDRGFVTGGHGYAILLAAPDSGWAATIDRLRTVFASFRPAQ
jgi:eukaryotic-like serine/threonine-protein kinase